MSQLGTLMAHDRCFYGVGVMAKLPPPLRSRMNMRGLRSTVIAAVTVAMTALGAVSPSVRAAPAQDDSLLMTYNAPAPLNRWQEESLPIGNGAMGASIFGQVTNDEVFLNEKTLWTGGPGVPGYRYGNYPEGETARRHENLQEVIDTINEQGTMTPSAAIALLGQPKLGYGSYQSFGKLKMDYTHEGEATNYERSLDLNRSLATVSYDVGDVSFTREYFASYPDNVIAMRVSADEPGALTFRTTYDPKLQSNLSSNAQALSNAAITADGGRITLKGAAANNGLRYNAQVDVEATGGQTTVVGNAVQVTGADSAVLIWSAGTDYELSYPDYRSGEDPAGKVTAAIDGAVEKGFDALQRDHEADYKELFDRVVLDLGGEPLTVPTDEARRRYTGTSAQDRSLEELYYQYGRYLLISSSREGSLPANLQGVWNERNNPPWSADYHTNINLQMNYWPALSTNLGETTGPYLDYIADLAKAGAVSARNIMGFDKGWMVMNETTPYGFTGVFDWPTAAWFPEANAWIAQAYYWEYLYNRDEQFLRDEAWPVLKGAADFWVNYLQDDPRDNTLVANPSYSPEHGPFSAGASMSQQIAYEVFDSVLESAEILGLESEVTDIKAAFAKVDPGLHIDPATGRMKEWKTDGITGEAQHRQTSHLYALFPGREISVLNTPDFADAARATLIDRGDGGTGWSMAWKINMWAHLHDGDHAHRLVTNLLRNSTYPNLWDAHPPFQIDGNFGGTSGMTEMLLQNAGDTIAALPALPSAWAAQGSVDGLRAHNGVTFGATWASGAATELRIATDIAGPVKVATSLAEAGVKVTDAQGATVESTVSDGVVTFTATEGGSYTLVPTVKVSFKAGPTELGLGAAAQVAVDVTGAPADSRVELVVPEGWRVTPQTATASGDATVEFTATAGGATGPVSLVARLVHADGVVEARRAVNVFDPAVVDTAGLNVVAWNTQELSGEGPPNGTVTSIVDGNRGSYWHSQWSGAVDAFPHYVVIDLGEETELASMTYVPRLGRTRPANGQIGTYTVEVATEGDFVTPTRTQQLGTLRYPEPAGVNWSTAAQGNWSITTVEPSTVTFAEPVRARYLKLTSTGGYSDSGGNFSHIAELEFRRMVDAEDPAPSPTPTPEPSPTPTVEPTPEVPLPDHYTTPGLHTVDGTYYSTNCEPYAQTQRCWTYVWGDEVTQSGDSFTVSKGWVFKNLTYLPQMTSEQWGASPLANAGEHTVDGKRWITECGTDRAGGENACKSWVLMDHAIATHVAADGSTSYFVAPQWVYTGVVYVK